MKGNEPLSNVSLIVITYNEESNIKRCLESADGVGEIIVVDSFSTDSTVAIANSMGAAVFQRPYLSAADQKNWAVAKAGRDWILVLDADESLSAELRTEIERTLGSPCHDGYWLRRRNVFLDKRIRFCGWQRDKVLRLFRRGAGSYPAKAVHEKLELKGRRGKLRGFLDHNPYRDLDDYMQRMRSYSRRGAEDLFKRKRGWFPALVTRPFGRFIRMYFLQLGFLDGAVGLKLCRLAAVGVFLKYSWVREFHRRRADEKGNGRKPS
jgi:glycosyltransferase involved in cell wall biosynthesis